MKPMKTSTGILIVCFVLSPMPSLGNDAEVVARMGESSLSLADVRLLADANPDQAKSPQGLEKLIRGELIARAVADEARRQGVDKRPDVTARMGRAAELALASAYMNGIARPPADYPTEYQIRQAYETTKATLLSPRRYRISQIYLAGQDDKTRKTMEDLAKEARRKGADFAALARKHSKHAVSAEKGGDMGWLNEADLAPEVRDALKPLAKNELAQPLQSGGGWRLLRLDDRKEPEILSLDQVRDSLSRNLRLRKAAEIEAAYLDKLQAGSPIAINGIALEGLRKR